MLFAPFFREGERAPVLSLFLLAGPLGACLCVRGQALTATRTRHAQAIACACCPWPAILPTARKRGRPIRDTLLSAPVCMCRACMLRSVLALRQMTRTHESLFLLPRRLPFSALTEGLGLSQPHPLGQALSPYRAHAFLLHVAPLDALICCISCLCRPNFPDT